MTTYDATLWTYTANTRKVNIN